MSPPRQSAEQCPDSVLVERARARDTAAFAELICRHDRTLRHAVSRFVSAPSDQDDVLQGALLNAWRYLPAFEGRAKFSSWMYQVTANSALMLIRSERRKQEALVGDIQAWTQAEDADAIAAPPCGASSCWVQRPDEALHCSELRQVLQRSVADLSPRLREPFLLRYVDGLSIKETARALGLKENATKTRLHRACLALREAIHRRGADVAACRETTRRSLKQRTGA